MKPQREGEITRDPADPILLYHDALKKIEQEEEDDGKNGSGMRIR